MSSRFKLTSMEIASMTILTVVVAVFGVALLLNRGRSSSSDAVRQADSLATVLMQRTEAKTDTVSTLKKRKTTKSARKIKQPATPKSRNYLDEKAND